MTIEPSWDLYRTFAAVMREGSLSGAARVLRITQPSVGRHIEALEQAVGTTLFVRSQRGLSPTERALALRPYADEMIATSAALLRAASADMTEIEGIVRITASEIFAAEHLPSPLCMLRRKYPNLTFELVATDAVDDLLQRHADIAVRMVEPSQQALIAKKLGSIELGLFVHRNFVERFGEPESLADLRNFDLIGVDNANPTAEAVLRALPGLGRDSFGLRADNPLVQLAAIRRGFGIGVCQVRIAARDTTLTRVLSNEFSIDLPLWIVMHEDLRSNARCRAVFDSLANYLSYLTKPYQPER